MLSVRGRVTATNYLEQWGKGLFLNLIYLKVLFVGQQRHIGQTGLILVSSYAPAVDEKRES